MTRSKAREIEDDPENPDQISKFATMYPFFVTSPVPVEVGKSTGSGLFLHQDRYTVSISSS